MDPVTFFDVCCHAFSRAADKLPAEDLWLQIASRVIRLRFAGHGLRTFIEPCFSHLRLTSGSVPEFTIMIWDYEETGEAVPPRPRRPEAEGVLGRVADFGAPRFTKVDHDKTPARFTYWESETQVWMFDRERCVAFFWVRSVRQLAYWDRIHPLRRLIDVWANIQGLQMVHAGAASISRGGVLIVGPGGSGKSTTVLAMLSSGGYATGDDYVLVSGGWQPVTYSVFGSMRLYKDHRARFPFLMPHPDDATLDDNGLAKLTSYVSMHRPGVMVARLSVSAIVMPRPAPGRRTRVQREGGGRALFALAPNTLKQFDPQNASAFARMAALCRALPCWSIELGDDLHNLPSIIDEIIPQVGAG
jgi:hypothetical protein